MEREKLDWIEPGMDVLCYSRRGANSPMTDVRLTMIERVNKVTFAVAHPNEPKFRVDTGEDRNGDIWHATRRCVPVDSDEAREVLEIVARQKLVRHAEAAIAMWEKNPTRANRLATIAALEAVED